VRLHGTRRVIPKTGWHREGDERRCQERRGPRILLVTTTAHQGNFIDAATRTEGGRVVHTRRGRFTVPRHTPKSHPQADGSQGREFVNRSSRGWLNSPLDIEEEKPLGGGLLAGDFTTHHWEQSGTNLAF